MTHHVKFARVVLAISVGLLAGVMRPTEAGAASATVGALVVAGSGTISPGLTATPTNQAVSFSGTGVGAVSTSVATAVLPPGVTARQGAAVGIFSCNFNGNSPGANQLVGAGLLAGVCAGGGVGTAVANCNVNYSRVGIIVVANVNCGTTSTLNSVLGINVAGGGTGVGVFLFIPDQPPAPIGSAPITSYQLLGAAAIAGVTL